MKRRSARLLGLSIVLGLALLLWWWDPMANAPRRAPHPEPPSAGAPAPDLQLVPAPPQHTRSLPPPLEAKCERQAELACHDGDVFWFDSCGRPEQRFESCGADGCEDARCRAAEVPSDDCGRTSAYGECFGDVAEACIQGRLQRVDCAAYRHRCVMTSEGAACVPLDEKNGCRDEPPRCEGDRLKLCVDGVFQTIDCAARRARCTERGVVAQCELDPSLLLPPLSPVNNEWCDNIDNDSDGLIDEGAACSEVPLVAFVAEGATLVNLELRMQNELEILNQVFAPTKFRWDRVRKASASYRNFDPKDMEAAASNLGQAESSFAPDRASGVADNLAGRGLDFYIPVLFSEALKMRPAKSAISTLPNARCGGVRLTDVPSPVSGLIVLSETRQPETLAHEMGHYLGLCHTHEQLGRFIVVGEPLAECQLSGDSICDTPSDPGPPSCFQADACALVCRDGSRPDPFNIMSYYIGCRRVLTPEQLSVVARNLALRRGWFRCQDPRACPCEPPNRLSCPQEMSCRPSGSSNAPWYCELDGAYLPGASCQDSSQCSLRSFCAGSAQSASRCIRPCADEPNCSCIDVGLPIGVCREDLNSY
jgi:hypothetical protein